MSELQPEERLWNILRGAMTTKAAAIVADIGVSDALAAGPRRVEEVAGELGANPDSLRRLLRALASDGVFEEHEPGVFGNTPASELLLSGNGWRDFAHLFGSVWYRAVADLEALTGEATFQHTFGSGFWEWLAEHRAERAAFDRAMEQGKERRVERLAGLDWKDGQTVVDVGGGNGSLLLELVARQPSLRGIVFDLPETDRDESRFGDRIEFVEGSFFDFVPEGNVYVLGTVLHNWDDERAGAILRTIRNCAPRDARVLIIDSVVPPGNDPYGAKWLDLLMLALFGSRERDEAEWRALLESAGLAVERIEDGLIRGRPA